MQADRVINLNGTNSTFEAKRTFLSLILVVSNQPGTRQSLLDYLQNLNPTSPQSVLAAWQQVNNNPIDRQILPQYFAFLQDKPTARSSL
jgi:hypothetical protein